ncbi:DUF2946 family protein [Oxalobacteraceae bacterium A2-2]
MDDIVKQAMAKWPNVPYCYGWLALDARGHWRMRDERAQHLNLPGDKLTHAALLGFIARNYARDDSAERRGCWYFQNGPQRVYLELEATPYIVRTDPAQGWVLHTGEPLGAVEEAVLSEAGELILRSGATVAQLDDRDTAQVLSTLERDGAALGDEALLAWLDHATAPGAAATEPPGGVTLAPASRQAEGPAAGDAHGAGLVNSAGMPQPPGGPAAPTLPDGARRVPLRRLARAEVEAHFQFVRSPLARSRADGDQGSAAS